MKAARVSIIIATYNRAHFIPESLLSVSAQTHQNWECLIIDDGGSDNTAEVLQPILDQDSRFSFHKRPDGYRKGLPGCRNFGLDIANGDYVIFFDDDDIAHPQCLEISLKVFEEDNTGFVHYQKKSFTDVVPEMPPVSLEIKSSITKGDIKDIITQKIGLASCTVLWKSSCFEDIRFVESLDYAEEWECYQRIISNGIQGVMIDSILYYNRKHAQSNTSGYYTRDPKQRKSKAEAIVLVVRNLAEKDLLNEALIRHFFVLAYDFREYRLKKNMLKEMKLSVYYTLKWQSFYVILPLLLWGSKVMKKIRKN